MSQIIRSFEENTGKVRSEKRVVRSNEVRKEEETDFSSLLLLTSFKDQSYLGQVPRLSVHPQPNVPTKNIHGSSTLPPPIKHVVSRQILGTRLLL